MKMLCIGCGWSGKDGDLKEVDLPAGFLPEKAGVCPECGGPGLGDTLIEVCEVEGCREEALTMYVRGESCLRVCKRHAAQMVRELLGDQVEAEDL